MIEIKDYEVVINEGNSKCALIISENQIEHSKLERQDLEYTVEYNQSTISIYFKDEPNPYLVFKNGNKEILRHAMKSNGIPLCVGTIKTDPPTILFETYVNMR